MGRYIDRRIRFLVILALAWGVGLLGRVVQAEERTDAMSLSLEQLSNVEVTSVSRKPEKRSTASAAVYVITQEDLRRSGVTSISEALRLVPGVYVSGLRANKWAVGIRGFGTELSRSILVLIDGRSLYNPLFAGTYWDTQDPLLENIERIEVIRGPGGALWGSNAVNGVVNIITKGAKDTAGGVLTAGGGTEERGFGSVRYGGKMAGGGDYRVYGKFSNRDAAFHPNSSKFDDWRMGSGGMRMDWELNDRDAVTVQGDFYAGRSGERANVTRYSPPSTSLLEAESHLAGGNVLSRWQRVLDETSDLALQFSYAHTHRRDTAFIEDRDTLDLDFQHHFALTRRQDLTWGLGYRVTTDDTAGDFPTVRINPNSRTEDLISLFLQDEFTWVPDRLRLTLGVKVENNDYSGWEVQPSLRSAWTPTLRQTVWASVSRAVRTPSRIENDIELTSLLSAAATTYTRVMGSTLFNSEEIIAYELGYRVQSTRWLLSDIAAFYNVYDDLLSLETGTPFTETSPPPTRTVVPIVLANGLKGHTQGAEFGNTFMKFRRWRMRASYSFLQIALRRDHDSVDATTERNTEGQTAQHQVTVHTSVDLPKNVELDPIVRYVDHLRTQNIPSYWEADLRLGWRPSAQWSFDLVGQNLLHSHHPEFSKIVEMERRFYAKASWQWL